MTHTLHRSGSAESLTNDYVVLLLAAKGVNDPGSAPKFRKALEIAQKYNPVNLGNLASGTMIRSGKRGTFAQFKDYTSISCAVFKSKKDLEGYLKELKVADLGLSVTVSGLFDEVFESLDEVGLKPHTVQYSLGVFGNLKQLPASNLLDITTMCGHRLVSPALAQKLVRDIKKGKISIEDAARTLGRQCQCGAFNPLRAEMLLEDLVNGQPA